ncbi:inactive protein kinase SELMODRAFT_444075-like isoform X2 [Selaginella moellendorffii]|uniref:inactive protein kinase SELMODRAFT_444075-like isoform X2 n=1 Tax=Selaginella moellendorffii TaxID=88036 RepID=UPI000D1C45D3|nr:inactive protein kinase SELMODRAFT_444075-like isoform X2 [Selaginella moellendorffii]|eukprot:XP_024536162.1 inactive protein kinase SELMODRAFT_444075-like isoform X2 [Selaginella moellendorffii]
MYASPRRILVVVDASKDQLISSQALTWTLNSFARPDDVIRLLGVLLQPAKTSQAMRLGHKSRADLDPDVISAANEDNFAKLKENSQVALSFAIIRGFQARNVLLRDAKVFAPTWIVMDRFMKKEVTYINELLECNLAVMDKHGKGRVVKLVTPDKCDVDSSDLFELEVPLGLTSMDSCTDHKRKVDSSPENNNANQRSAASANAPAVSGEATDSTTFASELVKSNGQVSTTDSGFIAEESAALGSRSFRCFLKLSPDKNSPQGSIEAVSDRPSCGMVPISVQPDRRSEMLELLGGPNELETKLFDSYVEESSMLLGSKLHQEAGGNEEAFLKDVVSDLDRCFSVVENHEAKGASGNQGAAPLCHLCNNKSPRFGTQPIVFSFSKIEEATNKFSKENLVAEGGFGFVYKGVLSDGQLVAVKQHKLASRQGDREFKAEVEVLSSAQHRNLVTLIGYCTEGGRRILVYEFVCNGSLNKHLSRKNPKPLDWPSRQNIALGAARGLRYLHEECRIGCIVHRDVRPNNILVTHDFTALVGDFGLARWQARGDTAEQTRVIGTIGYVAPEYAETGQITEKADVYSFGLVLLEIITGRPAFDSYQQPGQQHLPDWATPFLAARAAHELLDERIDESSVDEYELINMVTAASLCIQKDPSKRPKMTQVVRYLEGDDRETTPLSPLVDHNANLELLVPSKPVPPRTSVQFLLPIFDKMLEEIKPRAPRRSSISYDEML